MSPHPRETPFVTSLGRTPGMRSGRSSPACPPSCPLRERLVISPAGSHTRGSSQRRYEGCLARVRRHQGGNRSEERRVGKEGREEWRREQEEKEEVNSSRAR